jgi:hypothetical protein
MQKKITDEEAQKIYEFLEQEFPFSLDKAEETEITLGKFVLEMLFDYLVDC